MLPANATQRSHELLKFAKTLIDSCPAEFYEAVAVTGSVSRGVADKLSDVEITFWLDGLDDISVYQAWLESLGTSILRPNRVLSNGSYWYSYRYKGELIECIWQSWNILFTDLQPIRDALTGKAVNYTPDMAWVMRDAVPLRNHSRLNEACELVKTYPDVMRRGVVQAYIDQLRLMTRDPHVFAVSNTIYRGEILDFRKRQMYPINGMLQALFAYNRQWEPDYKWLKVEAQRLDAKPEKLVERIEQSLISADLLQSIRIIFDLMMDTLKIMQDEFEVDDLLETLPKIRDFDPFTA